MLKEAKKKGEYDDFHITLKEYELFRKEWLK